MLAQIKCNSQIYQSNNDPTRHVYRFIGNDVNSQCFLNRIINAMYPGEQLRVEDCCPRLRIPPIRIQDKMGKINFWNNDLKDPLNFPAWFKMAAFSCYPNHNNPNPIESHHYTPLAKSLNILAMCTVSFSSGVISNLYVVEMFAIKIIKTRNLYNCIAQALGNPLIWSFWNLYVADNTRKPTRCCC